MVSFINFIWNNHECKILFIIQPFKCVCIPILVTTFPEWISGTEPLLHTPSAVRPSSLCLKCFAGLIRRTPLPTRDTAITNHHPDTTIFKLRAHWVRISWSTGSQKSFRHSPGGSGTLDFLQARRAPYPLGQALRYQSLFKTRMGLYKED